MHLFPSEYQNDLMSVKSKSESIQNVKMFNIFLLEGIDASCKDYLISSEGTLSSLANFAHLSLQAEIDEVAVLYAPVLLLILIRFHYFLSARPAFFFITTFSTQRTFASRGSEKFVQIIKIKGEKPVRVLGIKVSKTNQKCICS